MPLQLFCRLRRCRALFALALCAWLAMGSAAWAKSDCCASMDMHATTTMHADHHAPHPHEHSVDNGACTCAHAAVDRLMADAAVAGSPLPSSIRWQAFPQDAPQPAFSPPLRPPSA
ncbi:MAG TPA: hypothetical protein VGC19_15460 [Rhodanobacter sp.]